LRARMRALVGREGVIRDIDEELRTHLELAIDEKIARGMAERDAREEALREFGNLGGIRDQAYEIRGGGMLEALWQDVRFGVRMLRKHPALTLSAVATMALGIGATSAVFSVVHPLLIRGLPFHEADRLLSIRETCLPKFERFAVAPGNFLAWREQAEAFDGMAAFDDGTISLTGAGEPERLRARA